MYEMMYSTRLLQPNQTHNIVCSHLLCINAGYTWSQAQGNLLNSVLSRWMVPVGEYNAFIERHRVPEYQRRQQELEVLE